MRPEVADDEGRGLDPDARVHERQHDEEQEHQLHVVGGQDAPRAPGVERRAQSGAGKPRVRMPEPRQREEESGDEEEEVHAQVAVAHERFQRRPRLHERR